jgi:hypothetical protein
MNTSGDGGGGGLGCNNYCCFGWVHERKLMVIKSLIEEQET